MINIIRFATLLLIFIFSTKITSQNQHTLIDSTYNYISDKYYKYKFTDSIKAKHYSDSFLLKSKKENDTLSLIDGYFYKSEVLKNDSIFINYLDNLIFSTKNVPSKLFPAIAYFQKGEYYQYKEENKKSLENLLLAIKYTNINKNDSLKYIAKQLVGILKSKNNELNDSKKIYREVYNFYERNPKYKDSINYFNLLSNLTLDFLQEKKLDSANFYNAKATLYAKNTKDTFNLNFLTFRQGQIEFEKKNYKKTIQLINKSIPSIELEENYSALNYAYYYIAKSEFYLGNTKKTLKYNLLIDSLYSSKNIPNKVQKSSYTFLIKYYKGKNDLKNQLLYIEKLLKLDNILTKDNFELTKTFTEEFDTPNLIAQKERLINKLQVNVHSSNNAKTILGIIALLALILTGYQYRKRRKIKLKFEELINNKEDKIAFNKSKAEPIKSSEINLSKEIVASIIDSLNSFEENKNYTNSKLSLNSLAKEINTNPNYLSKIINFYKKVSYSKYISDLRINHCLELLNSQSEIRKYTIKAIAKEVGFNNSESFSNAFFKKTGLKPSYYIKELKKFDK
ncbi:AraC family transcriptional regulator [Lutibacter sp. Hel_I_33_5]|uniref:helix-turn-helix domain-containing protein n=1 Tax=Lutibacter sp. Hel_I_33_5 TaxID=1566289 RepID=UPI0016488612|nr:helix-turn-helix domain-containing protein [Lutibacter sp. Hel_I_33_5]